jgi:FkbM family methyltransferase
MAYEFIKATARPIGLYRVARWVDRHVIRREALRVLHEEMAFYGQFVKPGSLCFDVGANVGEKAEIFLALGAKVVAFEPQRDCMEELQSRLRRAAQLVPVMSALGSEPCHLPLYIAHNRVFSTFNKDWFSAAVGSVEVPVTTLDTAIEMYGVPDYCKIDVEGYELEVLKGLHQVMPVISYEYHVRNNGVSRALACLEYLSRFGDPLVSISPSDKPVRAGSRWLPKSEFIDLFRTTVPHMVGYHYGEIFVKLGIGQTP